jgi:two-component system, LytTR family, sensor kinase
LTVSMDSPPELDTARVPSLILQPFVENALVHGVGGQDGKVSVSVSASQNNGSLRLEVRDSGPGFREGASRIGSGGIGIRNSRERLDHMYGDAASLEVSNRHEGGVVVIITIPLNNETVI